MLTGQVCSGHLVSVWVRWVAVAPASAAAAAMGFRKHVQFVARTVLVKNNNVDEGMRVVNK